MTAWRAVWAGFGPALDVGRPNSAQQQPNLNHALPRLPWKRRYAGSFSTGTVTEIANGEVEVTYDEVGLCAAPCTLDPCSSQRYSEICTHTALLSEVSFYQRVLQQLRAAQRGRQQQGKGCWVRHGEGVCAAQGHAVADHRSMGVAQRGPLQRQLFLHVFMGHRASLISSSATAVQCDEAPVGHPHIASAT